MNVFYVDHLPGVAASYLPDKLIVKMPLETAQLLCTAVNLHGGTSPYKTTHQNHPSAIWARKSTGNFHWLFLHGLALCDEYENTYQKIHKCKEVLHFVSNQIHRIPEGDFEIPPQCMPDQYKGNDTIEAYRRYLVAEKTYYAKWKNRERPVWWK